MGDNNYRNNPQKIPGNKRPQRRRKRPDVPPAVIVIYVVMAVLILAICAVVFAITLKKTNNQGDSESSDSSVVSSADSSDQSNSSSSSDTSSESTSESSGDSTSSDVSSEPTSSAESSSSSKASSSAATPVDNPTVLPTTYSKEFFENDLFIGDSIFTGLSGYGYIDAAKVAAKIGYTPSNAMNKGFDSRGITAVDYAKQLQPKRIYIMLGSNTMAAGTNFDIIVSQYRELVKKLRVECPKSLICVISIPPVTESSSAAKAGNITNENIRKVNEKIKAMAKECEEEYFDLNSMLSDSDGYFRMEYAEQDGLHFRGNTYKVLLSALEKEMTP